MLGLCWGWGLCMLKSFSLHRTQYTEAPLLWTPVGYPDKSSHLKELIKIILKPVRKTLEALPQLNWASYTSKWKKSLPYSNMAKVRAT